MNISQTIVDLQSKIDATRARFQEDIKRYKGENVGEYGRQLGKQFAEETAEWRREIDGLKAPIVSMVDFGGRLFVATAQCVWELKGDALVRVKFEARG